MDEEILMSEFKDSNKNLNKKLKILTIITIIIGIICVVFITLYILEKIKDDDDDKKKDSSPLSLWNKGEPKTKIIDFINSVTVENSKEFIPKKDRIAVFDFDGTIYQETAPTYLDLQLYQYRALNDTFFEASPEQKDLALKIYEVIETGYFPEEFNNKFYRENAKIFQNMTIEEFDKYIKHFLNLPTEGFNNLTKGTAFYKPMIELINFLYKNDFLVYIVSASDRFLVRSAIDQHIDIPSNYIIGSESNIISSNQNDIDSLNYTFQVDDDLIFDGEFVSKNANMKKIYHIIREIGKKPVLSFGNSGGDAGMNNLAISNKKYKSMAFMILNDDTERENGNIDKADKMRKTCEDNNWVPISMKNDWKTIYGNNVTKEKLN